MNHIDLEKRVARLEAVVAQLAAWHSTHSVSIAVHEDTIQEIADHLQLDIDVERRDVELLIEVTQEEGIDLPALEAAVRQFD